jgi:DNA-binding transcriptional MerR regulator
MDSIGALSRRTGIPVKTIRYYSDIGLVPESRRTGSGYRHYDRSAVLRLELVRTLRELGFDLATIRAVLERRRDLAEVAAAQVEAIDTQIRVLRLRRAVLRRLAGPGPTDGEVERMHRLAHASAEERRRIMNEFLDHIFAGLDVDPAFEARFRGGLPELPDDPTDAQVEAWVELADLVGDPDFRASVRRMSEATFGQPGQRPAAPTQTLTFVDERVAPAMAAGTAPDSPGAAALVAELVPELAAAAGREDTPAYRRELADAWEAGTDARAERYWQLIGTINGWPPFPARVPAFEWLTAAVRATAG